MGLLQKVSDSKVVSTKPETTTVTSLPVQQKSNSVGLLKRSLNLSKNTSKEDGLDFFEFIQVNNISICSLLIYDTVNDKYVANSSIGLDADSICMSVSTKDFWCGILTQDNYLYTFLNTDNSILPLYQFFSKKLIEKIECLYAVKRTDGIILLFSTQTKPQTETIIHDISRIEINPEQKKSYTSASDKYKTQSDYYLYELQFSEAVDSFILSKYKSNFSQTFKKTIYENIFYELLQNFPEPSFIGSNSKGKIRIGCCLDHEIPFELLSNHLKFNLSFILNEHSQLLIIEQNGKVNTYQELKAFLEGEY